MKQTRLLMGMPIMVDVADRSVTTQDIDEVYNFFQTIDKRFSPYKPDSEISLMNSGRRTAEESSPEMQTIFQLARATQRQTNGYFQITRAGRTDPSGIVKGWAIQGAAEMLRTKGLKNFLVDAGGDLAVAGRNQNNQPWQIGIRHPFDRAKNVKILSVSDVGVATSGTYIRGRHIYNPLSGREVDEIVSLTVIGPNVYEADRFATAAFAMGRAGITFIEQLSGFEGYMIDPTGLATMTTGFEHYVAA